ncbi:hypothetical protein ACI48J_04340 [Paenibacillus chitinolyticus]|uniref:hypothetical protein n=1 Tax=Paenibacillus chitinolyticus TaxID=79263 RepID=UPI00386AA2ED
MIVYEMTLQVRFRISTPENSGKRLYRTGRFFEYLDEPEKAGEVKMIRADKCQP